VHGLGNIKCSGKPMNAGFKAQNWQDVFYTSQDGLRLYARYYPSPVSRRRAVLCLPGLTRNSRDFHVLASHLSDPRNPRARDVIAVDYRGRGRSQWDANPRGYTLETETRDVLDLMTIGGLADVAVIGTSRGGLIAMMMACIRPTALGAVVLCDIGPVIEREGLVRMIAHIGRVPLPPTWEEAGELVRGINARSFPAVPEKDWQEIARQWFNDDHGRPMPGYDPRLGQTLSLIDGPAPVLWPQHEMRLRHPNLTTLTVRGQGHAPLLRDRSTLVAIDEMIARTDRVVERGPDLSRLIA